MATINLDDGVRLELPDDVELVGPGDGRRGRGRGPAGDEVDEAVDAAFDDPAFRSFQAVVIAPAPAGRRGRREVEPVEPQVKVDVADDEDAVVLLEGEGGVFAWSWPQDAPAAD